MSSPARSSVSATSAGALGGGSSSTIGFGDESPAYPFPSDLNSNQDRKDEAVAVLKAELMAALQQEVKSLDDDAWKFACPRSQIHLISRPGGFPWKPIHGAKR